MTRENKYKINMKRNIRSITFKVATHSAKNKNTTLQH